MSRKALVLAVLTLAAQNAFADPSLQCKGVKGTQGQMTLKLFGPSVATAAGSYANKEAGIAVKGFDCLGQIPARGKPARGMNYYWNDLTDSCAFEQVRIPADLAEGRGGLVAFINSDGDTHDWSGNTYQYFWCE